MTDSQSKKKGRPKGSTNRSDVTVAAQVRARREVLRANREEDIRERISGGNLITRLEKIQAELLAIHSVDLEPVQVQRLGKAAEISLALLRKILPDLSATTITRRTEDAITIDQVSSDEREQINAAISRALGIAENGGGTPAQGIAVSENNAHLPRHEVLENGFAEYRECGVDEGSDVCSDTREYGEDT